MRSTTAPGELRTIPTIYDTERTVIWIAGFTAIHVMMAFLFITRLGSVARAGIIAGMVLLFIANGVLIQNRTADAALRVLPLFHVAMVLYAAGIGIAAFF